MFICLWKHAMDCVLNNSICFCLLARLFKALSLTDLMVFTSVLHSAFERVLGDPRKLLMTEQCWD